MVSKNTKPGASLWMSHGMNSPSSVVVVDGVDSSHCLVRPLSGGSSVNVPVVDLFFTQDEAIDRQIHTIQESIARLQKRLADVKRSR